MELHGFLWFYEFQKVSASFKFKLGFFNYFEETLGDIIRKKIINSDYHSAWYYWCKKDHKNLPETSHKNVSQCLNVISSFLWAFMVQNFGKSSFSEDKSKKKKKLYSRSKNHLFWKKTPRKLQVFMSQIVWRWRKNFYWWVHKTMFSCSNIFSKLFMCILQFTF